MGTYAGIDLHSSNNYIGIKKHRGQVFIPYLFAFLIYQSFFSISYLFLSFVLHACRTVILRIPQCRIANRFPLIFCRYIKAMKSELPSKVELTGRFLLADIKLIA